MYIGRGVYSYVCAVFSLWNGSAFYRTRQYGKMKRASFLIKCYYRFELQSHQHCNTPTPNRTGYTETEDRRHTHNRG